MPAWGGAVGKVLSDAALGYTNALLAPSREEEQATRDRKRRKDEADIALAEAHAAYYELGRPGSQGRLYRGPDGRMYDIDPETRTLKPVPGMEARPEKPMKAQERVDQGLIGIFERHYGKPFNELSQEEINHPDLADTLNLLRKRNPVISTPTGFVRLNDVLKAQPGQGVQEVPARTGAGTPSTTTPAAPGTPVPAPTPPTRPPPAALPPGKQPGGKQGPVTPKGEPSDQAHEQSVRVFLPGYEAMTDDNLKEARDALVLRQKRGWSRMTQAQLDAANRVLIEREGQKPAAPSAPSPAPGTITPIQTGPQAAADQEARAKAQRDKEAAERDERKEYAGTPSNEQNRVANDFFVQGVNKTSGYYSLLTPEEKKRVDDHIEQPKKDRAARDKVLLGKALQDQHQKAMKLALPYIRELDAMESTAKLTAMIVPLIGKGTVSIGGKTSTLMNVLASWLPGYKSDFQKAAEKMLKEQGLERQIDDAHRALSIATIVEGKDPNMVGMTLGPNVSKLEVLSAVLAYSHALTMKLRGGGGGRQGVTVQDLKKAEDLFNPSIWGTSPDILLARLTALQQYIQEARPRVQEMVRSMHINPDNQKYEFIPYELETTPGPEAPSTADMELLNK